MLHTLRTIVRGGIRRIAGWLDRLTHHRLTPNMVTIAGTLLHIVIALLIAFHMYLAAAIMLAVVGLFDTLDGELARLQQRTNPQGMLLDASTDRFKETLLYTGAAYSLALGSQPYWAVLATAACGASICVSYVKAKGEAAIASSGRHIPHAELNRLFADGLATFEIRMVLLIAGLLLNLVPLALAIIAALAGYTALQRLVRISRKLRHDQA